MQKESKIILKYEHFYKILFVALILLLSGCNIFSPRSAEPPENFGEWEPFPVNYIQVLENIKTALIYPQNSAKYPDILADNFIFVFDYQDYNELDVPHNWGKNRESAYLVNFHNQWKEETDITFFEIEGGSDYIQTNSAVISRNYEITIKTNNGEIDVYRGKFVLTAEDYYGFWKIRRWEDYRTSNTESTWGRLKDKFDY